MRSLLLPAGLALFLATTATVMAEDRAWSFTNLQASAPIGLTVQITALTVTENATMVGLVASFDARSNQPEAQLNGYQNAYIAWGDDEADRIYLRRVAGNPTLTVENGQTMQGELVFPGVVPDDVGEITLVFNPNRANSHSRGPGFTIPIELAR